MLDNVQVGASGLSAASAGFNATAQNIANAQTPGFSRRAVELSLATPIANGAVRLGQGVEVDGITRNETGLLGVQIQLAAGDTAQSQSFRDALAQVEPLVNETFSAGARTELAEFFDALSLASADPSDPGLRDTVLQASTDVAEAIERLGEGFERLADQLSEQLQVEIPPLSQKMQRVAILNQRLRAAGGARQAPDVADQLNRLLRELGEKGGFAATISSDGSAVVLAGGNAVVEDGAARELVFTAPDQVAVAADNGSVPIELGGELGGLLEAYEAVTGYLEQLNTFAADFANAVNAVNAGGFDQAGNPGGDLFTFDPANPATSFRVATGVDGTSLAFSDDALAPSGNGNNLSSFLALEDTLDPGTALSNITNQVSIDVATASERAVRDELVLSDLDALDSSLNGVNLDEEAVNLQAYQTAYQASARVLTVANDLLGTLLELA